MAKRYPILYRFAQFVVTFFVIFTWLFPTALASTELLIASVLIVVIGIPHGATDHLIFLQLRSSFLGGKGIEQFYVYYLLLMVVYGVLWWLMPAVALAIFLLLSIYHFGQSNWNYVDFTNKIQAWITYLLWGSFVLLIPIVWNFEVAAGIIASITRSDVLTLPAAWAQGICLILLLLNVAWVLFLRKQQLIDPGHTRNELWNLTVLSVLFFVAPLLLSFTIYFVFWHSLSSMADQIQFFKNKKHDYTWKSYIRQALPMSLIAVGGLALLYVLQNQIGFQANVGLLFIFISVVTLPHLVLIDLLYSEWEVPEMKMSMDDR